MVCGRLGVCGDGSDGTHPAGAVGQWGAWGRGGLAVWALDLEMMLGPVLSRVCPLCWVMGEEGWLGLCCGILPLRTPLGLG